MTFKVGAMVIDIYGIHLPALATDERSSRFKTRRRDGGHVVKPRAKVPRGGMDAAFAKFLGKR